MLLWRTISHSRWRRWHRPTSNINPTVRLRLLLAHCGFPQIRFWRPHTTGRMGRNALPLRFAGPTKSIKHHVGCSTFTVPNIDTGLNWPLNFTSHRDCIIALLTSGLAWCVLIFTESAFPSHTAKKPEEQYCRDDPKDKLPLWPAIETEADK